MTQFNPFVGSILQSANIARQQSANKMAQLRRVQELQKNVATRDDEMEHQVESSEELSATHDRDADGRQSPKPKDKGDDENPHLDLRA